MPPVLDTRGASRECRSRYNAPSDGANMVPLKDFEAPIAMSWRSMKGPRG
jgi:hypothetical protein